MKKLLLYCTLLISGITGAQDFMGYMPSNYSGVTGALVNPANIVDSRMKFDAVIIGQNTDYACNYLGVKTSSLPKPSSILKFGRMTFPDSSWNNSDKKSPDYWKNNLVMYESDYDKAIFVGTRIALPSFMVNINAKNAIALNIGLRNYGNMQGLAPVFAEAAWNEFADPAFFFKKIKNDHFGFQQMTWVDYGLTYARVLNDKGPHFLKAGITPKLLQGLTASYVSIDNLEFSIDSTNIYSFISSEVSYGYSENIDFPDSESGPQIGYNPSYGFGLDIGGVYEWRPKADNFKYSMDGVDNLWRKNENKYKLRASLAVNDIGSIKFNKGEYSNDFDAKITAWNIGDLDFNGIQGFDSTMTAKFGSKQTLSTFNMGLPTTINAQVDYHLGKFFYLNLMGNIGNIRGTKTLNVHDYTTISLAPRVETPWLEASIPVSYNTFAAQVGQPVKVGLMLRMGPLVLGTNDLLSYSGGVLYSANFYFLLKVPIPYTKVRDRDKDGISDKKDLCKTVPGTWEFKGCPDRDGDHVRDEDDKCPDVPGLKELAGCPDRDADGITDLEDSCPDEKGPERFKGCPDTDADDIIDKEDECPFIAGKLEFKGCPDTDSDGTPDKDDLCPEVFGPLDYQGCPDTDADSIVDREDPCPDQYGPRQNNGCPWPDTDKDGVLDKEDECPLVAGVVELKGCPKPVENYNPVEQTVVMKPAEKKIIEKAFASLEFATAKDIIKPKSFPGLDQLAKLLLAHSEDWKLKLAGHTDDEGKAEKNLVLSEKRAKAVKNYLIKKGVKEDQIICEWFGQTMPIGDNKTPKGRQKNRRVEMKIQLRE